MFILKNAWISIKRNKGRNILIGIIILIIACACTITLAIKNTAEDLINSYKSAYDKEVTISFDRANMMKDFDPSQIEGRENAREKFDNIASYTIDDVKSFADSNYIESYYYTYSVGLNGNNIEKAEIELNNNMSNGFGRGKANNMSLTDFTLTGYSSVTAMSEFINGTYTMNEITDNAWDIAFDGNYVFINQELADYNNLDLNDKIKLETDNGNIYEFEIIGIFKENEEGNGEPMSMFSNSANTLVTNADAVANITNSEEINATINPTFIINSYDNVEKLQNEFYQKGLDENFVLQTNEEEATSGVSSIENINSFATTFLTLTLIIGGIVLFVINMINIRERKYEIGVLRTIGISKFKLTMQFVSELVIVSVVALILGAGIGAVSSKGVSNSLLASEINSSNERDEEIGKNFGGPNMNGGMFDRGDRGEMRGKGMPVIEAYDSIDAVVDIKVLLELLGIGLSLVLVSSIASMVSIERFTPLTILKERS